MPWSALTHEGFPLTTMRHCCVCPILARSRSTQALPIRGKRAASRRQVTLAAQGKTKQRRSAKIQMQEHSRGSPGVAEWSDAVSRPCQVPLSNPSLPGDCPSMRAVAPQLPKRPVAAFGGCNEGTLEAAFLDAPGHCLTSLAQALGRAAHANWALHHYHQCRAG